MDIKENYKDDIKGFLEIIYSKCYIIPLFLFSFISYYFSLVNRTISMDDFAYRVFYGQNHLDISSFRWFEELCQRILLHDNSITFISKFYSVIFLIVDSILLSYLVYIITRYNKTYCYTIMSSIFVTYPLINELFEFNNYTELSICILFTLVSLICFISSSERLIYRSVISGLILTLAMSGYESAVFIYIPLVFFFLFYETYMDNKFKWFVKGISFTIPLFIAVFLKYAIGYLIITILGLDINSVGNASIKWISNGFISCCKSILYNGWYYVIRALSYLPISEFIITLILFILITVHLSVKKRNLNIVVLGILECISLFSLSILQGEYLHYRNAQTIQIFVSILCFIVCFICRNNKKIEKIVYVFLLYICFRQSLCLHTLLSLNNQRSDNEASIFRNIGYKLYSEFDIDKTIVFCGEYQLGDYIEDQITVKKDSIAEKVEKYVREITNKEEGRLYQEYVCTNVNSYYNTQKDAFNGQIMIKYYMSYYGFDINVLENLTEEEEDELKFYYEKIAKAAGMKPYEIRDMGTYILVYLGPTIDGINYD